MFKLESPKQTPTWFAEVGTVYMRNGKLEFAVDLCVEHGQQRGSLLCVALGDELAQHFLARFDIDWAPLREAALRRLIDAGVDRS